MKAKLAIGIVLAVGCVPAMAENSGGYAGLGIGSITLEDSIGDIDIEATDTGFKLFGGYRFNRYFSVEAAYIDAGSPDDTIFGVNIESDAAAVQGSVIGTLPVSDQFGLYLRGSLIAWESDNTASDGFTTVSESTDGNDFGYGVGAIFSVTQNFSLRGEFEGADFDGTDLRLLSVSGLFSF